MYREIITPTQNDNMIAIPKEYWNQKVEILVLPFNEMSQTKDKKFLKELLDIGVVKIDEVRMEDK